MGHLYINTLIPMMNKIKKSLTVMERGTGVGSIVTPVAERWNKMLEKLHFFKGYRPPGGYGLLLLLQVFSNSCLIIL